MDIIAKIKVSFLLFLLIFTITGCATMNYKSRLDRNVLGLEMSDERKCGIAASRYIESKYRVLEDKRLEAKVDEIGQELARVSGRPLIGYTFKILDTDEFNASSLPDGYIYIFKGLIDLADDDERVAAVLAHEIAHVSRSHAMKRLYRSKDCQGFIAALTLGVHAAITHKGRGPDYNDDISSLIRLGTNIAEMILYSGYSQTAELEADKLGMVYMKRAGYNPREFISMLERLKQIEPKNRDLGVFRTHPPTSVRIEEARNFLKILPEVIKDNRIKHYYIGAEFGWDYDLNRPCVTKLINNSPAEKAGLKLADIVLGINNHKTDLRCRGDFEILLRDKIRDEFKKGQCDILIKRNGNTNLIKIKPAKIYEDPDVINISLN